RVAANCKLAKKQRLVSASAHIHTLRTLAVNVVVINRQDSRSLTSRRGFEGYVDNARPSRRQTASARVGLGKVLAIGACDSHVRNGQGGAALVFKGDSLRGSSSDSVRAVSQE